jgi:hemerythrin-like metal-binding protein
MITTGKDEKMDYENRFLLKIPVIDEQHAEFFRLIDETFLNIQKEEELTMQRSIALIKVLEDYLKYHLLYEEALMEKANYPDIEKHILQHKYFINKIEEYKLEISYNSPFLMNKLIGFMKKWFLFHIIQTDSQYKDDVTKIIN